MSPAPGLWTPLPCFPQAEGNPFTTLFPASRYEPQRLSAQKAPLPKVILTNPLLSATHEPAGRYIIDHLKSDLLAGQVQTLEHNHMNIARSLSIYMHRYRQMHLYVTFSSVSSLALLPPGVLLRGARMGKHSLEPVSHSPLPQISPHGNAA